MSRTSRPKQRGKAFPVFSFSICQLAFSFVIARKAASLLHNYK